MEIINGTTRTIYLPDNEDKVLKIPRKINLEKGIIANIREYENTLIFPNFSAQISYCLHWTLIVQEKLKLINNHPIFNFYLDLRKKCILNPWRLSCNSFTNYLWKFDREEFEHFFQWMLVSLFFKRNWLIKEIKKFHTETRHNILYDKNYWINKEGKVVLIDLWAKNLDSLLKEMWNDIFLTLNKEITSWNNIINV